MKIRYEGWEEGSHGGATAPAKDDTEQQQSTLLERAPNQVRQGPRITSGRALEALDF